MKTTLEDLKEIRKFMELKYYCYVCKKDTVHRDFKPYFINDIDVCEECKTLKEAHD